MYFSPSLKFKAFLFFLFFFDFVFPFDFYITFCCFFFVSDDVLCVGALSFLPFSFSAEANLTWFTKSGFYNGKLSTPFSSFSSVFVALEIDDKGFRGRVFS